MSLAALLSKSPVPADILGDFRILEVLYEMGAPLIFTATCKIGQQLLAYVADEDEEGDFLLLAPCSNATAAALLSGSMSVNDAFTTSWLWLARRSNDGEITGASTVAAHEVPQENLPTPGTVLYADLEPVLSTRALGGRIVAGSIPASVISYVADSTRKAMKVLLDFTLQRPTDGRPTEEMRALYDLPVSRFAFASFELDFAAPRLLVESDEFNRAAKLLQKGINWASSHSSSLDTESEEERTALLKAVLNFTPPSRGPIEEIEVGGRWLHHERARLTRATRRRVHGEIMRLHSEKIVRHEGRIGALDRDNLTFVLRDTEAGNIKVEFDEEILDDAVAFFASSVRVVVAGFERGGPVYATAVAPAGDVREVDDGLPG